AERGAAGAPGADAVVSHAMVADAVRNVQPAFYPERNGPSGRGRSGGPVNGTYAGPSTQALAQKLINAGYNLGAASSSLNSGTAIAVTASGGTTAQSLGATTSSGYIVGYSMSDGAGNVRVGNVIVGHDGTNVNVTDNGAGTGSELLNVDFTGSISGAAVNLIVTNNEAANISFNFQVLDALT
ncbi:MAG: hypothetical protein ACPGSK_08935, partial [Alphaproteobacteria bacterium]